MPADPTIPDANCPPFSSASARDLLAGILLANGGNPANIPNTAQCREWGYGKYTERDILAAILLATGTGGGGVWGSITGTLSDQTDLQTALNGKLGVSAQAADVNPAGTAIAAALGAKLNLTGGTLSGALNFSGTTHAGIRLNNLTTTERNAIGSPAAGMLLWNTTQSRMNVHNGSAWTDGFVRLAGDAMTGALSVTLTGLGTTPSQGFTLANSTAATVGTPAQVSPSFILEGQGWKTDATAASQIVRFRQNVLPFQGTANPSATFRIQSEINNSGTFTDRLTLDSAGTLASTTFRLLGNTGSGMTLRDAGSGAVGIFANGSQVLDIRSGAFSLGTNPVTWGTSPVSAPDTVLERDAANTLALRNGTNAQTLRVYGTFTDASNHRRINLSMSTAGVAVLRAEGAGTGASGNVLHISSLPTANPGPGILWNNAGTPAIGT